MKANKALKRLAKIEALMSVVTERYSASAPHIREVLQDAKAAVARARETVQASSRAAKLSSSSRLTSLADRPSRARSWSPALRGRKNSARSPWSGSWRKPPAESNPSG